MAAKTTTADKPKAEQKPEPAPQTNLPAAIRLRMPYPVALGEYAGIDQRQWSVLIDAIWPSAKTVEGVCMAINYCKSRNLDPFKKVVHIVPVTVRTKGPDGKDVYREIETVWPGIAEVRITATRTGVYAGKDAAVFGPTIVKTFEHIDTRNDEVKKQKEVEFPEWCQLTVYKIVQGIRCAFVGPKVYWEETYATENRFSAVPNEMWSDRRSGQLEKCTEAAALRAAFPEELGGEYTAEEMHGKVIEGTSIEVPNGDTSGPVMTPPRPERSAFERNEQARGMAHQGAPKAEIKSVAESASGGGDPRPEPPGPEPEPVVAQAEMHAAEEVEEEEGEQPSGEPSKMFVAATKMVNGLIENLKEVEPDDLAGARKRGRDAIDSIEGLEEEERDVLRGRFVQAAMEEEKARGGKKKPKK